MQIGNGKEQPFLWNVFIYESMLPKRKMIQLEIDTVYIDFQSLHNRLVMGTYFQIAYHRMPKGFTVLVLMSRTRNIS